jgi:hypothetical protein
MTLWAVPITAGMVTVLFLAAAIALIDLTTQGGGAALLDGLEGLFLTGPQAPTGTLLRRNCADNVRQFQHRSRRLKALG